MGFNGPFYWYHWTSYLEPFLANSVENNSEYTVFDYTNWSWESSYVSQCNFWSWISFNRKKSFVWKSLREYETFFIGFDKCIVMLRNKKRSHNNHYNHHYDYHYDNHWQRYANSHSNYLIRREMIYLILLLGQLLFENWQSKNWHILQKLLQFFLFASKKWHTFENFKEC